MNKFAAEKFEDDGNVKNNSKREDKKNELDSIVIEYDSYNTNKTVTNGVPMKKLDNKEDSGSCFGLCGVKKKNEDEPGCILFWHC